ncbi:MAG: hypothetical protein ACI87A_001035 [Planctomycetota bacterium]|jgi:hypothetical protein
MNLHFKVPYIQARFAGDRDGLFMLDCGAAAVSVMFFFESPAPLVKA